MSSRRGRRTRGKLLSQPPDVVRAHADRRCLADFLRWGGRILAFERKAHQLSDHRPQEFVSFLLAELAGLQGDQIAVLLLGNEQDVQDPYRSHGRELIEFLDDPSLELVEGVELERNELNGTKHGFFITRIRSKTPARSGSPWPRPAG